MSSTLTAYESICEDLKQKPRRWLVTGVAGFIGSNLAERLLSLGQVVVGLDNFSTGHQRNLDDIQRVVGAAWSNFSFIKGDVQDPIICAKAVKGVDIVLHQAALGSVPRSIETPITTNGSNVDGFLTMLVAAKDAGVKRFVYASSSAVYGDSPELPKVEHKTGALLSPYAVSKAVNELYAGVFGPLYGLESIGLRYFNVFGPRQDPAGAYAAVIPRWIGEMLKHTHPTIYGDGKTSRDFCFISNVVQANILAGTTTNKAAVGQAFNIAVGGRTTLTDLYTSIRGGLSVDVAKKIPEKPIYKDFRAGDIAHSHANIDKAIKLLGYQPTHTIEQGMKETVVWYSQYCT